MLIKRREDRHRHKRAEDEGAAEQTVFSYSPSQPLWYHWLWVVTGSLALHMSGQAFQINEWPPELLTLPWAARDVQTLWQPIYNQMKTPQSPWCFVVVSWIQTSCMFGTVVERGNVATGHHEKSGIVAKIHKRLCSGDVIVCVFLHLCVQHCESGHTAAGSAGELDVWECKV